MTEPSTTPTPKHPDPASILAGLRLLNLARSALLYCEHELGMLDGDGLPLVTSESIAPALTQALYHANDLRSALAELGRRLSNDWSLQPEDEAAIRNAANALDQDGAPEGLVLYGLIAEAVGAGAITSQRAADLARTITIAIGRRAERSNDAAARAAAEVLGSLLDPVWRIATDQKFGAADLRARLQQHFGHHATVASVAAIIAST